MKPAIKKRSFEPRWPLWLLMGAGGTKVLAHFFALDRFPFMTGDQEFYFLDFAASLSEGRGLTTPSLAGSFMETNLVGPVLYHMALCPFLWVFGLDYGTVRVLPAIFGLLGSLGVLLLLYRLYRARVIDRFALGIASILIVTDFLTWFSARQGRPEVLGNALLAATALLLAPGDEDSRSPSLSKEILAALLVGLAMFTHWTYLTGYGLFVLYSISQLNRETRSVPRFLIRITMPVLALLTVGLLIYGHDFVRFYELARLIAGSQHTINAGQTHQSWSLSSLGDPVQAARIGVGLGFLLLAWTLIVLGALTTLVRSRRNGFTGWGNSSFILLAILAQFLIARFVLGWNEARLVFFYPIAVVLLARAISLVVPKRGKSLIWAFAIAIGVLNTTAITFGLVKAAREWEARSPRRFESFLDSLALQKDSRVVASADLWLALRMRGVRARIIDPGFVNDMKEWRKNPGRICRFDFALFRADSEMSALASLVGMPFESQLVGNHKMNVFRQKLPRP